MCVCVCLCVCVCVCVYTESEGLAPLSSHCHNFHRFVLRLGLRAPMSASESARRVYHHATIFPPPSRPSTARNHRSQVPRYHDRARHPAPEHRPLMHQSADNQTPNGNRLQQMTSTELHRVALPTSPVHVLCVCACVCVSV